jgi:murein DD-endopeptidase MepM/ murein hydrolase activator NlpD
MKLVRALLVMAPSLLLGLVFAFIFSRRMTSPKEKMLKAEIQVYQSEIARMNEDMQLVEKVLDDIQKRDEDLYRAALYADEFPEELRLMGTGGSDKYAELEGLSNSELIIRTANNLDRLERRLHAQTLSFKELIELAKNKEKLLASIPAIQPVRNNDLKKMASGFGWRIDPVYKTSKFHSGMDFTADIGTEVYCTGDGYIEDLERNGWGYGNCIVVNHGFGYRTRYAHLSAFKVSKGQKVKRGDLIGLVGTSGKSTGPHLHYEVEKGNKKLNPIHYYHSDLSPEQYEKLLKMSENSFKAFD